MKEVTFEEELNEHGTLIFTNVGVSMLPLLRQGRDLMVIKKKGAEPLKKYDAVLFKRPNGQYILHRILKIKDGRYYIVGDNCTKGEYVAEEQVLGVLTEVVRDGKKTSADDKRYRFYVHMICDFFHIRVAVIKFNVLLNAVRFKLNQVFRKK